MNTITVWQDKIILRWDGVVPPAMEARYEKLSDNQKARWDAAEEILKYWPHVGPYARWNKKLNAFLLSFSKQNLIRIHRDFGMIPVLRGQERIESLKALDHEYKRMKEMIHHLVNDPIEKLPKLSFKLPPLGDYQYRGAGVLTYVRMGALFADCGCLAKDTIVKTYRSGGARHSMTISQLYKEQERLKRKHRRSYTTTKVLAFNGKSLEVHPIERIVEQGVKPVVRVSLKNWKSIKATPDHEFLTMRGWVQAQHLTSDDCVMVEGSLSTPQYSAVTSVVPAGEEMTYDIVCRDPYRNFVANGMVVHNCGKTYMVLASIENQIKQGLIERGKTLIAVKLPTIETGWIEDTAKFTDLKVQPLWIPGTSRRKEKLKALLDEPADFYVTNHEGVLVLEDELVAKNFQKVVIDESTILKGFRGMSAKSGGAFGKAIMNVAHAAPWRVIMSGTPAPNGSDDLWGQMKFLDPDGLILEPSFYDFRSSFMKEIVFGRKDGTPEKGPSNKSKWVVEKKSIPVISELINPFAYRVQIRDHLKDLPEKTVIRRTVHMSKEQSRHYWEMHDALSTMINDEFVAAEIKLTQMMKLRQITGGFLIDQEENTHEIKDNPKLAALDDLLNEEIDRDKKVVIYAQYRWEVRTIAERYKSHGVVTVYGENSAKQNLESIKEFIHNPKVRLIVLHPKSMAHGVTFTVANYMIFYSISHSAEDDYQCVRRIERAGQKNAMFVYYLLAKDPKAKKTTIDEDMYVVLQNKIDNQSQLIDQKMFTEELLKRWR